MADPAHPALSARSASPLFLREEEVREGIDRLLGGHARLMRAIDPVLEQAGLGRAHYRALQVIARYPSLSVGQALQRLAITKQSLGRVLKDLEAKDMVERLPGPTDRREVRLKLTPKGISVEAALFERVRQEMARAYQMAGRDAVGGYWTVLEALERD